MWGKGVDNMDGISSSLWGYREWTLDKSLEDLGRIGYGGVEMVMHALGTPVGFHLNQNELPLSEEKINQLINKVTANKLKVVCLSPSSDFLVPPGSARESLNLPMPDDMTVLRKVIDLAAKLGKPYVRPFPCSDKPMYMTTQEALDIVIRGLRECTEYAESFGVKIAVDITHSRVTGIIKNAVEVIGRIDSDYCGINIHTNGRAAILLAEAFIYNGWGDKIFHTHLVDSKTIPGQRFGQPVPLGEGDNYIEQFMLVLRDARYAGWFNYEGRKEDAKASFDYLNLKLKELRIV
jgi:sugar phosphate isomerase/epimerase